MVALSNGGTDGGRMPLAEHLRELRTRVIRAGTALLIGVVVSFVFRDRVISLLESQVCGNAATRSSCSTCG